MSPLRKPGVCAPETEKDLGGGVEYTEVLNDQSTSGLRETNVILQYWKTSLPTSCPAVLLAPCLAAGEAGLG